MQLLHGAVVLEGARAHGHDISVDVLLLVARRLREDARADGAEHLLVAGRDGAVAEGLERQDGEGLLDLDAHLLGGRVRVVVRGRVRVRGRGRVRGRVPATPNPKQADRLDAKTKDR